MRRRRAQAEIEQDIGRTRDRLAADFLAIEEALTPRRLAARGTRLIGRTIAVELDRTSSPVAAVVLPLVLIAIGVVWLSLSRRPAAESNAWSRTDLPRLSAGS
jgi:hypothetical protein